MNPMARRAGVLLLEKHGHVDPRLPEACVIGARSVKESDLHMWCDNWCRVTSSKVVVGTEGV